MKMQNSMILCMIKGFKNKNIIRNVLIRKKVLRLNGLSKVNSLASSSTQMIKVTYLNLPLKHRSQDYGPSLIHKKKRMLPSAGTSSTMTVSIVHTTSALKRLNVSSKLILHC